MQSKKIRFLILGAGPTGLGAAYRLKEYGIEDYLIIEADSKVGGLAKSFVDEKGFTWDVGGHVQFSHYPYFDDLMDLAIPKENWNNLERESWVWVRDRFVPYPFQNNIRFLPKDDLFLSLEGLLEAYRRSLIETEKPKNFLDWIQRTFGSGIGKIFMEPYNFKVWATPPEKMSYQWIGERVSVPDLKRILQNLIFEKEDVSWGPNNTFRFPKNGGTGAIWERVADLVDRDKILLSHKAIQVKDQEKKLVCTIPTQERKTQEKKKDEEVEIEYEYLLSTIPLNQFCGMVESLPVAIQKKANTLQYSNTNVVGIGLKGSIPPHLQKKCWMYFPEKNNPFYRATVFSHYSENNVPYPKEQWSLMLEISESQYKPVNQQTLQEETKQGCIATKLIQKEEEIETLVSYRFQYGYPTPSLDRDEILQVVQPELEKRGLFSRGRFGGWKYEVSNQDHSLMQGVEWVDRMIMGAAEDTYACKKGLGAKEPPLPKIKTPAKIKMGKVAA